MRLSTAIPEFLTWLRACGYSNCTIDLYSYVLRSLTYFATDLKLDQVTIHTLINYMAYLTTLDISGSTRQNHWKGIRTFFRWAFEIHGLPRPDLYLKLPPNHNPKLIMPFSECEVRSMLSVAMARRTYLRDTCIILVLLDTGIRSGELCRLNMGDLALEMGELYIAPYGNSNHKTKSRVVQLGNRARVSAWHYISSLPDTCCDSPLFREDDRLSRLSYNALRTLIKRIGNKAGVRNCHPHRFRHTMCIEFLRNGGDVFNLQKITGHATLDMLNTYLDITRTDIARVHKLASPVDHWKL